MIKECLAIKLLIIFLGYYLWYYLLGIIPAELSPWGPVYPDHQSYCLNVDISNARSQPQTDMLVPGVTVLFRQDLP